MGNNSAILAADGSSSMSANKYEAMKGTVTESNSHPYNRRAMSDDYFPDDFNDRLMDENNLAIMDMGDPAMLDNDDDDDFKECNGNNLMFLDNLGNPDAQGYDD